MSLVKSTAVIGSLTMLSRIVGFVRDVMIANAIGASWLSDAFFVAFKLPNFFRRLFAEGAFNAAFVPQFSGLLTESGRAEALRFASEALSVLLVILLLLNAVFMIFMPWILPVFAPGFVGQADKYDLTVTLARIAFPYILFISLVSLLGGILNSIGKFAAVAAAPVMLNICLIVALLVLPEHMETPAHALSVGVFAAGVTQFIWVLWACARADALPSLVVPRMTAHVRKLLKLIAPVALGAGVIQVNLLIDLVLASNFDEGVSYLYYADRLNELPIGVIGVAVGTALLPLLSKQIREGDYDKARYSMNRAIELVLLFGIPSTIALIVIPKTLITVLYQHGAFSVEDTYATYTALIAFGAGLPAFLLAKILAPGFYAAQDTKTPFYIAIICVATNLCLNLILMQYYEHVGLAMATSIAAWVNVIIMGVILYRRNLFTPDQTLRKRTLKIHIASAVMGLLLWWLDAALAQRFNASMSEQVIALSALIAAGLASYAFCIIAMKTVDMSQLKTLLTRRR